MMKLSNDKGWVIRRILLVAGMGYAIWMASGVISVAGSCGTVFRVIRDDGGFGGSIFLDIFKMLLPWRLHEVAGACDLLIGLIG